MIKLTKVMKCFLVMLIGFGVFTGTSGLDGLNAQEKNPIILGSIYPLTGANAVGGTDMQRGQMIALEEINAAGGVLGRPLKILVEDSESRPAAAIDAVHKLVDIDKVPLVLGAYASGSTIPLGKYCNSQRVVHVAPDSSSPGLREIGPYSFGMMALDDVIAPQFSEWAMKDSGAKTWGSITVNNAFGIGVEIHSCKRVEELGGKCVSKVRYERFKTDYRAELGELFGPKPEGVFFTAYGEESKLILKNAYELELRPPKGWYAIYETMWSENVIPETAEGIKGCVEGGKPHERFEKAYVEKFGEKPPTVYASFAYDAVKLVALAINAAKTTDPDAVRAVFPKVANGYKGISGDKTLDKDGQLVIAEFRTVIFHDGKVIPYP